MLLYISCLVKILLLELGILPIYGVRGLHLWHSIDYWFRSSWFVEYLYVHLHS
jgi:hypothetical protein